MLSGNFPIQHHTVVSMLDSIMIALLFIPPSLGPKKGQIHLRLNFKQVKRKLGLYLAISLQLRFFRLYTSCELISSTAKYIISLLGNAANLINSKFMRGVTAS